MPTRRSKRAPRLCPVATGDEPARRIACLWLPQLGTDLEYQRHPELAGLPLVLVGYPPDGATEEVLALARAGQYGLTVGMPTHAAISRCPGIASLPYDGAHYRAVFLALLLRLDAVSPSREPMDLEAIYLDLSGLPALSPDDPWQVQAAIEPHLPPGVSWRLGLAGSRFTSWCAAHVAKPTVPVHVPDPDAADFLDRLPVSLLPAEPRLWEQLEYLGLRTLGQFARVPRSAMLARFGWQGELLHQLAAGEDRSPLMPFTPVPVLREEVTFGEPAVTVAEFEAALETLAQRVWSRADRPRGGIRQLRLHAQLEQGSAWDRTLTLRRAYEQWPPAVEELRRRLEGTRPVGALLRLAVELTASAASLDRQLLLFLAERERRREQLVKTLEELRTRLGRTAVYRLTEISPRTPVMEDRWRLIAYDPSTSRGESASSPTAFAPRRP